MKHYAVVAAPFGSVGLVAGPRGLSNVVLTAQTVEKTRSWLGRRFPDADYKPDLLVELQRRLADYFAGQPVRFRPLKMDLTGLTPFQRAVLQACVEVGYGETATYGELARRIARPQAARAVGAALARNPLPLLIPCHRIIAGDGSLGGFSAEQGVRLKRQLLELESRGWHGQVPTRRDWPVR